MRGVSTDLRQHLGRLGERLAAEHLQRRGYAVLERNWRSRHGELDIVACDGAALVFCEVKTRRSGPAARPFDALNGLKQRRVRTLAMEWLATHPQRPRVRHLRCDAIGVTIDPRGHLVALEHLEGAF